MQVKNRLAGSGAYVQHRAVTIFDRPLPRNVSGDQVTASKQFGVFCRSVFQAGDVFLRDNQHVGGALRVQILKGKRVLVFENFLGWHFAANDPAK